VITGGKEWSKREEGEQRRRVGSRGQEGREGYKNKINVSHKFHTFR